MKIQKPKTGKIPTELIDEVLALIYLLFGKKDPKEARTIMGHMKWITLPGGETLFRQGEVGDSVYLVVHGRMKVHRETNETVEEIKEFGPARKTPYPWDWSQASRPRCSPCQRRQDASICEVCRRN